jgi:hypothetical protein
MSTQLMGYEELGPLALLGADGAANVNWVAVELTVWVGVV